MRAIRVVRAGEPLQAVDVARPEPAGTEVRIRVAGCGVCHTDLHIADGTQTRVRLPVTLGHEVTGWVDAIGPAATTAPAIGEPVIVSGGWGCGTCRECMAGAEQRCATSSAPGFQVDGGYAEAMLVPHARHLVQLGTLDPVRAAPLADAGITSYRAVRRAVPWLVPGARVLAIGCGALGQFALQFLRGQVGGGDDLRIGVQDLTQARLDRARALGADAVLLSASADETVAVLGGPADAVFDFVGTPETLAHAAAVVAPGGLVTLIGEAGGALPFGFERVPVESWFTTVAWGSVTDLEDVVALAAGGHLEWSAEPVPLDQAADAHGRVRAGDVEGRLVLVP